MQKKQHQHKNQVKYASILQAQIAKESVMAKDNWHPTVKYDISTSVNYS